MPTNRIRRQQPRLRYFDSLFLTATEFNVEQTHFLALRRYFNYLMFDQGRLHVDDAVSPLEVVSTGGMNIEVTSGSAMLIDSQEGHEVTVPELPAADRRFSLAGLGLTDGESVTVTLGRAEEDFVATGTSGGAVGAPQDDRTAELALLSVNLPGDPPPATPFITLATITAVASGGGGGVADSLNITSAGQRGGIKLAILSESVRSAMGSGGPAPTLTGISILGPDPVTVTIGTPVPLTVNGSFSSGPDQTLTAGDIDSWTSSDPLVVTVNPSGVVAGVSVSAAPETLTVTVGAFSDTVNVNVVAAVAPIAFDAVTPFNPTVVISNANNLRLNGTGFIDPADTGDVTATTTVEFLDGPAFAGGVENVLATSPQVTVLANGVGTQTIRVQVPPSADWPVSGNLRVVPRVTFNGASAVPENSNITANQLRVVVT